MAATEPDAAVGPEPGVPTYRDAVPSFDPAVSPFGTADAPPNGASSGPSPYGGPNGGPNGAPNGSPTASPSAGLPGSSTGGPTGDPAMDPAQDPTPTRGGGRRRAARAKQVKKRRIPAWLEILGYVVVSLTLTSLIKTFLVQMYYIPSPSMEPTTYRGDRVFVDKLSTWVGGAPTRGQVVVFHDPHHWMPGSAGAKGGGLNLPDLLAAVGILPDQHDDLLIKRIVGAEGDTIECKTADGPVYRNDQPLDESGYIMNGKNGRPCANGAYKVTVPKGNLWVLGDNREHSGDSSWNFIKKGGDAGFVPTGNVVGHVVGVVSWLRDDHPAGS